MIIRTESRTPNVKSMKVAQRHACPGGCKKNWPSQTSSTRPKLDVTRYVTRCERLPSVTRRKLSRIPPATATGVAIYDEDLGWFIVRIGRLDQPRQACSTHHQPC